MSYSGLAYRAHHPIFVKNPISGEGARLYGGRFNRVGLPALYLATSVSTAIKEISQSFEHKFDPITLCCYEVNCINILDLTDESIRHKHNVQLTDLSCAWSLLAQQEQDVPSWEVADRLIREGVAGILVPSWAPGSIPSDKNLILWKWSAEAPYQVLVVDKSGRLEDM